MTTVSVQSSTHPSTPGFSLAVPGPGVPSVTRAEGHRGASDDGGMSSFAVRYRSRGEEREVRWTDGQLTAEPLIEVVVHMLIRSEHAVRADANAPAFPATLETPRAAALTILEALHEVGAHIVRWDGDPQGIEDGGSGNEPPR